MDPKDKTARQIIGMALRRVREGGGSYGADTPGPWRQQAPDLNVWLAPVRFAIIGGLATRLYMPERMTLDVDVLIRIEDLDAAENALRKVGAQRLGALSIGGSSWRLPGGQPCDLIVCDEPWSDQALDQCRHGPDGLPYIDLPWLVLLKLVSSRTQDLADISRMLGLAETADRERVRAAIARYRPQDSADLDSLILLGRKEADTGE